MSDVKQEKKLSVKIFSIACTVLTAIIVMLTCYVLISMVVAKSQKKPVSLFGTSFAVVLTSSMEPEIMTGEMIFFKKCDIGKVKEGDNIVFVAGNGFDEVVRGQNIVHKAYSVTESGIVTKGVNEKTNATPDKDLVTSANFLGICTGHSAFLGALFIFLSKYGILILVAIIAIPIIISQIVKIVRYSRQSASADGEAVADSSDGPLQVELKEEEIPTAEENNTDKNIK